MIHTTGRTRLAARNVQRTDPRFPNFLRLENGVEIADYLPPATEAFRMRRDRITGYTRRYARALRAAFVVEVFDAEKQAYLVKVATRNGVAAIAYDHRADAFVTANFEVPTTPRWHASLTDATRSLRDEFARDIVKAAREIAAA